MADTLYEVDLPKLAQDIEHVHETGKSSYVSVFVFFFFFFARST